MFPRVHDDSTGVKGSQVSLAMDAAIIEDEDSSLGFNYISSVKIEDFNALTGVLVASIDFVSHCIKSNHSPVHGTARRAASWQQAFLQENR